MNGSDPLLPAAAGYMQIIDYDWRRGVGNDPDDLDVPAWVRERPESDPSVRARRTVARALADVEAYDEGREAIYIATREDEALALAVLGTLRDWVNGQTYAARIRFLALVFARLRRGI